MSQKRTIYIFRSKKEHGCSHTSHMLSRDDHIINFIVLNFNESSVHFNIRTHIDNEDKTEEKRK